MRLRLKDLREARGLTQKEVARTVGVEPAAISKWERGENQLKVMEAAVIADLLDCSIDDLVGREPRETSYEQGRHDTLELWWARLNHDGKTKLLEYARLLALDPNNTR